MLCACASRFVSYIRKQHESATKYSRVTIKAFQNCTFSSVAFGWLIGKRIEFLEDFLLRKIFRGKEKLVSGGSGGVGIL